MTTHANDDLRIEREDHPTPRLSAQPAVDESWAREALFDLARQGLIEQRRARRWRVFFRLMSLLLFTGLLALLFTDKNWDSGTTESVKEPSAAIIEVHGVIAAGQEASAQNLIPVLERAFKNPQIKGVILRMNSPGGSPVQAGEIYDAILRLRKEYPSKPIYAVVEDLCASGGYYIAAATDKIYANQASLVGSIGVRMDGFGFVGAMQKLGIESRLLTSGANKAMLDPFTPQNPQQVAFMQNLLDEVHQQFITAVKNGRGDRLANNSDLFSGLIYTGADAQKLGLIDGIASVRQVVRDQLHLKNEVDFTPKKSPFEELLSQTSTEFTHQFATLWADQLGPKLMP